MIQPIPIQDGLIERAVQQCKYQTDNRQLLDCDMAQVIIHAEVIDG